MKVAITVVHRATIRLFLMFVVKPRVTSTVWKFSSVQSMGRILVGLASISPLDLKAETNSQISGKTLNTDRTMRYT